MQRCAFSKSAKVPVVKIEECLAGWRRVFGIKELVDFIALAASRKAKPQKRLPKNYLEASGMVSNWVFWGSYSGGIFLFNYFFRFCQVPFLAVRRVSIFT